MLLNALLHMFVAFKRTWELKLSSVLMSGQLRSATWLCTLVSPSLPCASCRSVVRLQAASFLSAIGDGLLIAVLSGVFTARQMKNELCVSPHSFEVLAVCVRSRIQNELRDSHLLHERIPPSCLLAVLLHGRHWGLSRWRTFLYVIRAASQPRPRITVHCYLRGRRCTAAPNVTTTDQHCTHRNLCCTWVRRLRASLRHLTDCQDGAC